MIPTVEMLNAYFDNMYKGADIPDKDMEYNRMMYWAGIAAYAHLSSPASEPWRKSHGFTEGGNNDTGHTD